MKPKLYLETTVPSYLAARPSRDIVVAGHQEVTRQWWGTKRHEFDVFVSQFVLDEAGAGDSTTAAARLNLLEGMPLLEITADVSRLARHLIESGVIPSKAATDAAHVAVSAVHGMEYLVTGNCAHLANARLKSEP